MREVFQRWGSHVGRHDPLYRAWPGPLRPPPAGAKFLPDELRRLMRAARDAGEARALGRELRADPAWLAALCRGFAARYCGTVTMELEHIPCSAARKWGYGQLRSVQHPLPKPHQRTVLKHLLRAEMFEHYLAKEFPASKRFSLEGCEALIPGLHALFETGSQRGLRQVFVGMAHRGRLNVLRNLLGKPIGQIGLEMEGKQSKFHVGDVKYHDGSGAAHHRACRDPALDPPQGGRGWRARGTHGLGGGGAGLEGRRELLHGQARRPPPEPPPPRRR